MQDRLIQRYLGNKSPLADRIVSEINVFASPGDLVFDAFAGTLTVSAALKNSGFRVAANDINYFTWVFARAYFSSDELPDLDEPLRGPSASAEIAWANLIHQLTEPYGNDIPSEGRRTDIFDHYCELGEKSAFQSSRGSTGRRRFFSPDNAILIDRVLSRIRHWHRQGYLSEQNRCIALACLLSAVEKISNTQGTYHDFPRVLFDTRASLKLTLRQPLSGHFSAPASQIFGRGEDSLDFVKRVPHHRAIYIDPPYNFRQYTSYYFMLNLLSEYPEIKELSEYFDRIQFVRGQNMGNDFKSTFCSKTAFMPSLKSLINSADADYVIMSYFNGRNHWGEFKSTVTDLNGRQFLEEFFASDMFVSGSAKCVPIERLNYQSYGGFAAGKVEEFLFVARKARLVVESEHLKGERWTGQQPDGGRKLLIG